MRLTSVYFVGPLPPPIHGFSTINQKILIQLQRKINVKIFNTVPGSVTSYNKLRVILQLLHRPVSCIKFFVSALLQKPNSVYIALSGGPGQIFDAFCILIARLCGSTIFVHHHTFAYLMDVKSYNRICLWYAQSACHIVLCDAMSERLTAIYGIAADRTVVLSNAAFFDSSKKVSSQSSTSPGTNLTVGFLSNITIEKGLLEFIEVIAKLREKGFQVKGLIAGPVENNLDKMLSSMLENHPGIEYIGPIYGVQKSLFFNRIDVLLFPSKLNEAEPVTILEALEYGVPVVANSRGCIDSIIDGQSGCVVNDIDCYVPTAIEYLESVMSGVVSLEASSVRAAGRFELMQRYYGLRLEELITRIVSSREI